MRNQAKWIAGTMIIGLLALAGCSRNSSITLTSPVTKTALGEEVVIGLETSPSDLNITSDSLVLTGPDSRVSIDLDRRTINFSADTAGSYEICLEQDGVRSNTICLTVTADENTRPPKPANGAVLGQGEMISSEDEKKAVLEDPVPETSDADQATPDLAPSEGQENESTAVIYSVDEVLNTAQSLADSKSQLVVEGLLPMTVSMDASGNLAAKIYSDDQGQYLVLSGKIPDFGGCPARLTGTLSYNGSNYVLTVSEAVQIEAAYETAEE